MSKKHDKYPQVRLSPKSAKALYEYSKTIPWKPSLSHMVNLIVDTFIKKEIKP